jgi:hypothetical protein
MNVSVTEDKKICQRSRNRIRFSDLGSVVDFRRHAEKSVHGQCFYRLRRKKLRDNLYVVDWGKVFGMNNPKVWEKQR